MTDDSANQTLGRDVFVSYASQDRAVANSIIENLERHGCKCWIAPRDVTPGSQYADEIVGAINDSKVMVLLLSEHVAASPHVGREIERAASKRRRIIVLRIDAAPLTRSFEYFLSESQWIDVAALGMPAALAKLTQAVGQCLAPSSWVSPGLGVDVEDPADPKRKTSYLAMRRVVAAAVFLIVAAVIVGVMVRYWPSKHGGAPAPVVAAIPDKSIAVLPFTDMSEKRDQEYFADGLSEELINMLTKVSDLRVPARTSSFYFKGKQATIADVAKALSVANILEGSVRKSGNTIRITAQLIRVDNGYHLWSETYDRKLDDIFKIQDEIATKVVDALKLNLQRYALPASLGTQSVVAYDLYQQGRQIALVATSDAQNETALDFLEQALAADPSFAVAWATKSQVLDDLNRGSEARHAAAEALKIYPNLPQSHTALARISIVDDLNLRDAEEHLKRALELDPNDSWALSWMGQIAGFKGHFDEAIQIFRNIIARDPVNYERYKDLSRVYFEAGRYEAALVADQRARELNPGWPFKHFFAANILMAKGDAAGALAELDLEKDERLRDGYGSKILMYDALGRKPEADAALAKLQNTSANKEGYEIARVYASRGDLDAAFTWFARALRNREYEMFFIKIDPLLKNVRTDPRFEPLLMELGLQD